MLPARVIAILATITALSAACGSSNGDSEAPHADDPHSSANLARARESAVFLAAEEAVRDCMESNGYFGSPTDGGVVLKDGSLFIAEGGGRIITGAYLEYLLAEEACEDSSGFTEVAARHGIPEGTSSATYLRAINERTVKQMKCMDERGWAIPEPVMLRGWLIYDIPRESDEARVAWMTDWTQCNMELFGNPTGWN